jgi:quinol monooxygenase YgiN
MVYEIVQQSVDPAQRDEYVRLTKDWLREANFAGSHGVQVLSCVEDPARVMLIIEWDNVEAHRQHRGSPAYNTLREHMSAYQRAPSVVQHFSPDRV